MLAKFFKDRILLDLKIIIIQDERFTMKYTSNFNKYEYLFRSAQLKNLSTIEYFDIFLSIQSYNSYLYLQ